MTAGMLLWLLATVMGATAAAWFSLAGLGWGDDGFFTRIYWDESESGITIGFGVVALVVWGALLWPATVLVRNRDGVRSHSVLALTMSLISVGIVVVLCCVALGWPEPPSEFPTPPWNRA